MNLFTKTRTYALVPVIAILMACGCGESHEPGTDGNQNELGEGLTVTLGVFFLNEAGGYDDAGVSIDIEVGVPCFTWTRTAPPHDEYTTPHDHFNAADQTSFVDGEFTWTEYGPGHSQEEIDEICAAGINGTEKTANTTEYTADHGGNFYLRVTNVE